MDFRKLSARVVAAGVLISVFVGSSAFGQASSQTPLLDVLKLFTAPEVPALGPGEEAVKPRPAAEPALAHLPGKGLAQHPMLYVGEGYNKMYLITEGKIIWTYQTGGGNEYDDVWMLSNGNILFTRMQYVAEITPKKEIVWRYDAPQNTEIHTCQPLGLDKVLFVQNGLPPQVMIVNIKTRQTEFTHDLDYRKPANQSQVHPQFRRFRYTAQGTYLAPYLNMNKVVEYDKDFKEIWKFDVNDLPAGSRFSPWAALRLKNGNTLITNEAGNSTIEVTPQKKIVWEFKTTDLPEEYRLLVAPQSCTRLVNGNTIFCSRGKGNAGPQLVEVTPDKKVVWVLRDWANLGPATAVQILDDPGIPEHPGESEH